MIDFGLFQTSNPRMAKVIEMAQAIAITPSPILISGESGVGKSLLVKFILEKARNYKNVVRWGREPVLMNDGDLIVIDNLDELDIVGQTQISEMMDLCKRNGKKVRWIATCRGAPSALVSEQKIRKDLFYRLSVIHLQIPALRDRREDVLILSQFFVRVFNLMRNHPNQEFSKEAQAKLAQYNWSGNVTELESVIERAVMTTTQNVIEAFQIEFPMIEEFQAESVGGKLAEMERKLILQTLRLTQQNKTKAAQILGISIRTLRNKLNEYRAEGVYESNI